MFITSGELAGMHIAAMNTPAKCQTMKIESAMRMNVAGRPERRDPPSRVGVVGRGFGAGGGVEELGVLIAAPTMFYVDIKSPNVWIVILDKETRGLGDKESRCTDCLSSSPLLLVTLPTHSYRPEY